MNKLLLLFFSGFFEIFGLPLDRPNTQGLKLGGAFPEFLLIGLLAS